METDILILGSGVAALKTFSLARERSLKALIVDPDPLEGGTTAPVKHNVLSHPRIPILLPKTSRLINLASDHVICRDVEIHNLKEGDYISKLKAYENIEIQQPWPLKWIEMQSLCFIPNLSDIIKQYLNLGSVRLHVISNVRRIDLDRKLVALSIGSIIKFKKLIYTWPIDIMTRYVYTRDRNFHKQIHDLYNYLNFKSVGLYVLSILARPSTTMAESTMKLYIHATKASRMHTVLLLNLDNLALGYILSSFSSTYPPLAGLTEKLYSEIRKHRIIDPRTIIHEHVTVTMYGVLNIVDPSVLHELAEALREKDVHLFGRLAQWREVGIDTILQYDKEFYL